MRCVYFLLFKNYYQIHYLHNMTNNLKYDLINNLEIREEIFYGFYYVFQTQTIA